MDIKKLHEKLRQLTPYHPAQDDFRLSLRNVLKTYYDLLSGFTDPRITKADIQNIKQINEVINNIALNSYKGLPSTAYTQLYNLISKYIDKLIIAEIEKNTSFFRMRNIPERRRGISYNEMFHFPLNQRRMVNSYRYSISGYPCLYLGVSVYGCWEEMNRPILGTCWTSLLKNNQVIRLLDLRVPEFDEFENNLLNYIHMYPFILACMIPVKDYSNGNSIYKPEYLIPQLLIEWIIKQAQKTNKNKRINEIIGVYYTSSHINQEFNYPLRKSDNVAIPVIDPLAKTSYCPVLSKLFSITEPLNIEIEKLKCTKIDCGTFDNKTEQEQQIENYSTSDFYYLENERLKNMTLKSLTII